MHSKMIGSARVLDRLGAMADSLEPFNHHHTAPEIRERLTSLTSSGVVIVAADRQRGGGGWPRVVAAFEVADRHADTKIGPLTPARDVRTG